MHVERFAPSPTGLLHLGHAYSAWLAHNQAKRANGRFLLRLEDLDTSRCRPAYYDAITRDLKWLGLSWNEDVVRQSERQRLYDTALNKLSALGLTYPCSCTRKDIAQASSAPQEGSEIANGPDGPIYPGTCRDHPAKAEVATATRLNMSKAIEHLGGRAVVQHLSYDEIGNGAGIGKGRRVLCADHLVHQIGDVVLSRKDSAVAYHLAVVVDDADQAVTHVTRGEDLAPATPIHRVLQALLGLPTPVYNHHALVRDENGKRLAKRDDARAIATYRAEGYGPEDVLAKAIANLGDAIQ